MKINNKIKTIIFGMLLKVKGDTAICKNKLKLSALSLIDNSDVILNNEYWIQYLPNFEQQRFYDEEYYKMNMEKWNKLNDINIKDCIRLRVFYLKNVKNKIWYEEAKKIYVDGYLILPMSRPVIPGIKSIDSVYAYQYLENKIAYFSISDYIKCIEEKNKEKCKKDGKIVMIKGTVIEILALTGLIFSGKIIVSCGVKMADLCFRRSFNTIQREIGEIWERDEGRMRGDSNFQDCLENSDTCIEEESIEWLEMDDDTLSQKSDITIVNDFEIERENIEVIGEIDLAETNVQTINEINL